MMYIWTTISDTEVPISKFNDVIPGNDIAYCYINLPFPLNIFLCCSLTKVLMSQHPLLRGREHTDSHDLADPTLHGSLRVCAWPQKRTCGYTRTTRRDGSKELRHSYLRSVGTRCLAPVLCVQPHAGTLWWSCQDCITRRAARDMLFQRKQLQSSGLNSGGGDTI